MEVFVVSARIWGQGDEVVAICSTEEKADQYVADHPLNQYRMFRGYEIETWELDFENPYWPTWVELTFKDDTLA